MNGAISKQMLHRNKTSDLVTVLARIAHLYPEVARKPEMAGKFLRNRDTSGLVLDQKFIDFEPILGLRQGVGRDGAGFNDLAHQSGKIQSFFPLVEQDDLGALL